MGSEIAARNRKSLATFHRTLKSQCTIALSCLRNRSRFLGSAMGIAIANRKNRCDFGELRCKIRGKNPALSKGQPDEKFMFMCLLGEEVQVHRFLGVIAFIQHAPKKKSAPPTWKVSQEIPEKSPKVSADTMQAACFALQLFWPNRRYTPAPVALQGVATPLSRRFLQFAVCSRGVAATPPPKGPIAPHPVRLEQSGWHCRRYFGPPSPCRAPGGGAATLASVALPSTQERLQMKIWGFVFAFAFVMARQINFPDFLSHLLSQRSCLAITSHNSRPHLQKKSNPRDVLSLSLS